MSYSKVTWLLFLGCFFSGKSQVTPEVNSWIVNTTNDVGYNGLPTNVQKVQFSANNVYVSASCIPGYDIGPWAGNPNVPANQNFVFKITRHPVQNTGTAVNAGLGHIGVWTNGVSIFNAKDGMSYNNAGVWNRNALFYEGSSFDGCLGHPAPNGEYHHHVNPTCLYNDTDSTHHSPVIGFAFDGFPIYGAYGFTNSNGTGAIKRLRSSYVLSSSATRANGPAVSASFPAGCYVEDYQYVQGSGDLDEHNGRFSITPEYPAGIYAYFVTIDGAQDPVYPYTLGTTYYGVVQTGNTGPGSGHNTVSETVQVYDPTALTEQTKTNALILFPNPASGLVQIKTPFISPFLILIKDAQGRTVNKFDFDGTQQTMDVTTLPSGIYFVEIRAESERFIQKLVISK